jgi:hypothetical protein
LEDAAIPVSFEAAQLLAQRDEARADAADGDRA